ncbi:hypothetical protein YC2023_041692 [Brassica napus]
MEKHYEKVSMMKENVTHGFFNRQQKLKNGKDEDARRRKSGDRAVLNKVKPGMGSLVIQQSLLVTLAATASLRNRPLPKQYEQLLFVAGVLASGEGCT